MKALTESLERERQQTAQLRDRLHNEMQKQLEFQKERSDNEKAYEISLVCINPRAIIKLIISNEKMKFQASGALLKSKCRKLDTIRSNTKLLLEKRMKYEVQLKLSFKEVLDLNLNLLRAQE